MGLIHLFEGLKRKDWECTKKRKFCLLLSRLNQLQPEFPAWQTAIQIWGFLPSPAPQLLNWFLKINLYLSLYIYSINSVSLENPNTSPSSFKIGMKINPALLPFPIILPAALTTGIDLWPGHSNQAFCHVNLELQAESWALGFE